MSSPSDGEEGSLCSPHNRSDSLVCKAEICPAASSRAVKEPAALSSLRACMWYMSGRGDEPTLCDAFSDATAPPRVRRCCGMRLLTQSCCCRVVQSAVITYAAADT